MSKWIMAGLVVVCFTGVLFADDLIVGSISTTNTAATNVLLGSVAQGSVSNQASGTYSHAEGDTTWAAGNNSHAEGQLTTAVGDNSHAEGYGSFVSGKDSHAAGHLAFATNDNTYVWSGGAMIGSTTSNQFTVHAANGIRLLGGPITGNGSGLTDLNASALTTGILNSARFPTNGLNASALTVGALNAARLPASGINAAALTLGTINAARLPTNGLNASALTTGTLDAARLPALDGVPLAQAISNIQQQVAAYTSKYCVTVQVTANEATNGDNLIAAYAKAKMMNPSADSRIAVIVPPGRYNLGTAGLQMDTSYIDVIGQTTDRAAQYLYGGSSRDGGVVKQTADYVRIENLTLYFSYVGNEYWDGSDSAAYFPTIPGNNTVVRNCDFTSPFPRSMRMGIDYAGYYENCASGYGSFGLGIGSGGAASGTFIDCVADWNSFGCAAVANGTFIRCQAGEGSFGAAALTSGKFMDCVSIGDGSFGGYGGDLDATAVLVNCTAGEESFGSFNMAATGFNYNASGHTFAGGTLSVVAEGYEQPSILLSGTEQQYKFMRWQDSSSGAAWDLSMDPVGEGNSLSIWHSPDGLNWTIPFRIDANGVLYGNGSGLTDLNTVATETDPVFTGSVAAGIGSTDIAKWNTAYSSATTNAAGLAALTASVSGYGSRITNLESQTNEYAKVTNTMQKSIYVTSNPNNTNKVDRALIADSFSGTIPASSLPTSGVWNASNMVITGPLSSKDSILVNPADARIFDTGGNNNNIINLKPYPISRGDIYFGNNQGMMSVLEACYNARLTVSNNIGLAGVLNAGCNANVSVKDNYNSVFAVDVDHGSGVFQNIRASILGARGDWDTIAVSNIWSSLIMLSGQGGGDQASTVKNVQGVLAVGGQITNTHDYATTLGYGITSVETNAVHARKFIALGGGFVGDGSGLSNLNADDLLADYPVKLTVSCPDRPSMSGVYAYNSASGRWCHSTSEIYKDTLWYMTDGTMTLTADDNGLNTPPATFSGTLDCPSTITAVGAGLSFFNRVYSSVGGGWWQAEIDENTSVYIMTGADGLSYFYHSDGEGAMYANSTVATIPPKTGWTVDEYGLGPAPTLEYSLPEATATVSYTIPKERFLANLGAIGTNSLEQTVSSSANKVPSSAAVMDAIATKAGSDDLAMLSSNVAADIAAVNGQISAVSNRVASLTAADVGAYTTNETDQAISNALSGIHVSGYVATNHIGNVSINGALSMSSNRITNISNPVDGQDAVTKAYLEYVLSHLTLTPQGDISMGAFTE